MITGLPEDETYHRAPAAGLGRCFFVRVFVFLFVCWHPALL
jgi:hypothetical protein